MKDKQCEWKKQIELLKQAIQVKYSYGNYSALLLPDERYVILDRSNLKFLLPSSDSFYTLPFNWKLWLKRGFIVVVFHVDYYFISNEYYIFSKRDKRFITTATEFEADKFLEGKSDYFIIRDVVGNYLKYAIFDKDGNQISEWFDWIHPGGLVGGYSDYYIAVNNGEYAIFNKDGNQISDWFYEVYPYGLVNGESDYYIALKGEKERAIFHKDGKQISEWFDDVEANGLVFGESDYYVAERNRKYAIFHRDGQQISDWYKKIYLDGLVRGQSDYYIVVSYLYVLGDVFFICKLGSSKCFGPLASVEKFEFIKDPSDNTVTFKTLKDQYKTITKQELDDFFEKQELEHER